MTKPSLSPCINVCVVDGQTGWCLGCARSLSEIAGWSGMSEEQQRAVLKGIPKRKESLRSLGKVGSTK